MGAAAPTPHTCSLLFSSTLLFEGVNFEDARMSLHPFWCPMWIAVQIGVNDVLVSLYGVK